MFLDSFFASPGALAQLTCRLVAVAVASPSPGSTRFCRNGALRQSAVVARVARYSAITRSSELFFRRCSGREVLWRLL